MIKNTVGVGVDRRALVGVAAASRPWECSGYNCSASADNSGPTVVFIRGLRYTTNDVSASKCGQAGPN